MFVGDVSKIIHETALMFTMSEKLPQIHIELCKLVMIRVNNVAVHGVHSYNVQTVKR